jgi:hypothetical protein
MIFGHLYYQYFVDLRHIIIHRGVKGLPQQVLPLFTGNQQHEFNTLYVHMFNNSVPRAKTPQY